MHRSLTLVMVQANPVVGDLDGNARQILAAREAHIDRDLVILPECFLTGYPLEDLTLRGGFLSRTMAKIHEIAETIRSTRGPAVLFGAPIAGAALAHNAAVLIRGDGSISFATKTELPNSDVFDEARVFASATEAPRPLMLNGIRLGVMICEDMWHGKVARALADELADLLIVINGSPFEAGKQPLRLQHARRRVADTGLPLIYANLVGGQDELVFDGASFALDGRGHILTQLPFGRDASAAFRFDADGENVVFGAVHDHGGDVIECMTGTYPDRLASIYGACVLGIDDYIRKTGSSQVFIGISGGIDSALVAAMAADALGPDRVTGVMMPSRHTGQESLDLADELMHRLGIWALTLPIAEAVEAGEGFLAGARGGDVARMSLARENMQARMRAVALMALANAEGGMVLTTGNKSEMSVGYATIYGDMAGGYNPLKDILKTDVWALARWRNTTPAIPGRDMLPVADLPLIPTEIIDRPPTAELKEGQNDEQALGSYEVLDELLTGIIEHNLDAEAARQAAEKKLGQAIAPEHAERIARLVQQAEHKRRQAPPGLKLTARGFGKGWRYPIANKATL